MGNVIALNISESRDHLWKKTKNTMTHVYTNHINEGDWFLKADDDTFVIVENLRYMLHQYSTDFPIYFGFKYKSIVPEGYMSGGAGYVLSKEALKRFVEKALPDPRMCSSSDSGVEDVEMGKS